MNKELENKALEIIQKLRTYNPAAGDDPRWFKQCLSDLEDVIIDDEISPEERERLKRIEKRKKLGTNTENTLYADTCFDRVKIDEDSSVDHCVVLPQVQIGKNCTLKDCIIDRHCIIPDGMEIGVDKALDSKRFRVSSTGKVVLVTSAMLKKLQGEEVTNEEHLD